MIYETIRHMSHMLSNLSDFLTEAEEFAAEHDFPFENLLNARLAPDMFGLIPQVQFACDAAKFSAARLSGKTPPSDADEETTLEELRARIHKTRDYLSTFTPEDFADAPERVIELKFLPAPMTGPEYLIGFGLPQLYFHTTTAYNILRHNGVKLGKRVFVGGRAAVE